MPILFILIKMNNIRIKMEYVIKSIYKCVHIKSVFLILINVNNHN